jgi:hypothetical protein
MNAIVITMVGAFVGGFALAAFCATMNEASTSNAWAWIAVPYFWFVVVVIGLVLDAIFGSGNWAFLPVLIGPASHLALFLSVRAKVKKEDAQA